MSEESQVSDLEAPPELEDPLEDPLEGEPQKEPETLRRWVLPLGLIVLTFLSTLYVGAGMQGVEVDSVGALLSGWTFSLPLMAILLAHEFGHYIAGRIHGVAISPPYFIPMPLVLLGTFGAVIRMRGRIRSRDALLDVGASGPLAGLAIALPVLAYGMWTSNIEPLPESGSFIIEGRSILYLGFLYALKGPIPEGHDIMLSPTAFAGWAGLLVTMINLIPVGQLDGGHVAYALFGPRQNTYSERVRKSLPFLGLLICAAYGVPAYLAGTRGDALLYEAAAGMHWLVWAGLLYGMTRLSGRDHPPTEPGELSPKRRAIAILTLVFFLLLFMPSWVRQG